MKKRGALITFEGTEGGGKSTQIKRATSYLKRAGYKVVHLREPGGTTISEAIREVILNTKHKKMIKETELLLYLAARAQIVAEKILPAIRAGKIVICDRYEDSTIAYQGFGRGLSKKKMLEVSRAFVRGSLTPKLTFLLDIDPKKGMKRGGRHDRMEKESFAFHRKVRQGFLTLAKENKKRFLVLDATKEIDEIALAIQKRLKRAFG